MSICPSWITDFNPLPPCGGRPGYDTMTAAEKHFNPLPPCGGRHPRCNTTHRRKVFQSTPSVWRETSECTRSARSDTISIHSLRVEGDASCARLTRREWNFNPLPPCGGRPPSYVVALGASPISIHSLRVEGDKSRYHQLKALENFNPLPPCGGRRFTSSMITRSPALFQSTPSVWRETTCSYYYSIKIRFQSTPSVWRETSPLLTL